MRLLSWGIEIHSTLNIDPTSSASQINKVINKPEFRKQLDSVGVALTASDLAKDTNAFRVSLNKVIKEVQGDEKTAKVKVGVEVNKNQAVKSINASLAQAAKELKKIKVNIDAQVDKGSLEKQLSGSSSKPKTSGLGAEKQVTNEKIKQSSVQSEINNKAQAGANISKENRAQIEASKAKFSAHAQELSAANQSFASLKNMAYQYSQEFKESGFHIDNNIKDTTTLENGMKRAVIEVRKYNDELKRSQTFRLSVQQNPATGRFEATQLTQQNTAQQSYNEEVRKGNALINKTVQAYESQIAKGSRVEDTYRKQIASLKQLQATQQVTKTQVDSVIGKQKLAIQADEQQAKATDLKTKMLHQHTKAMQQNARYIDKSGMNQLSKDINAVNLSSSNALPQLKALQGQMTGYVNQAAQATRSQMGIIENFQNAMLKFPIWMGASTLFFGAIQSAKTFITTIIDVDAKMTTLQKVMSDSADMNQVFDDATRSAERFGQTLSSVLDAYAEFARQGYEGADLTNFADAALITSNVGEVGAQEASEYLTSAAAQWQQESQDAMGNIDAWNNIANNYATTVAKLGEGQAKAGSTARAMGLDFDETNAVLGALTAQTKQSGSEIGNFIKAVFPRAYTVGRGTLEDLGIQLEDNMGRTKSAIELYREAAHAITDMNDADQAEVVKGLGGVHHYQRMQVLLDTLRETGGLYDQIYDASVNSAGSAAAENAVYMESLEAQINKAKVAIEMFSLALGEAFLEAGILEFITTFTNALTGITNVMNEHPALYKAAFGVLIALILSASKNMRALYATMSSASAIKGLFTPVTHQLSLLNTGMKTATDNSRKMTMANRELVGSMGTRRTAAQVATAATAAETGAVTTSTVAVQGKSRANQALAFTSGLASKAVIGLGAAARGLLAMTGVGLAISGVTFLLEKFINKSADATNAATEFAQTQDVLKQSMESDGAGVQKLVDDYEKLDAVIQSGDYSNEQLAEHTNMTEQLASLFPDLVAGTEEYGTSLSNQQGIIQTRIDLVNQQIEAEKELAKTQADAARQAAIDAGKEAEANFNKQLNAAQRKEGDIATGAGGGVSSYGEVFTPELENVQELIAGAKTLNDLEKARAELKSYTQEIQSQEPELYGRLESEITRVDTFLMETMSSLAGENAIIIEGVTATAQDTMNSIAAIVSETDNLGSASQNMLGGMANELVGLNLGIDTTKQIYGEFESLLASDSGFIEKMAGYESAVDKFQNATSDEARFSALKELESQYAATVATIVAHLQDLGLSENEINKVTAGFDKQLVALTGLDTEMMSGVKTVDDMVAHQNALEEGTDGATDALTAQQEAVKGLVDGFRELDGQMNTIGNAMEQLAETGFIDMDTMYDLIEAYPELLGQQLTAAEMQEFLQNKHNELNNQKLQNYADEMMTSEHVMQNIIADEDHKLHETAKRYGIDLSNYNTVAAAKEGLTALYNKGTVEQQNKIVEALGERYGIDLSNFSDLASKKAAIEAELMTMITEAWNAHIAQLQALAPELNEFLKDFEGVEGLSTAKDYKSNMGLKEQLSLMSPVLTETQSKTKTLMDSISQMEPMYNDLISVDFGSEIAFQAGEAADGMFGASDASDILGSSLNGAGDASDVVGSSLAGAGDKARKAAKDTEAANKAADKAGKSAGKTAKEIKDLGIEVERATKSFTKNTFVLNKHEEALRKINLQIEKQNLQTQKYATHSSAYRNALKRENKLNEQKLKVMQQQEKSLSNQIKAGKINEYGLVGQDVTVGYNKYNVTQQASEGGRTTARVTPAKSSTGTVAPFAGWKVNYGYSPQGGGSYGNQIGFNGGRHYGIDFGGKSGQAVRTPHGGQVVSAGWSSYGGGNQVEVYNKALDKTFTFMHMLGDLSVKAGQTIQAGQQVGRMGSTGNSTGTHLHFQVNGGRGVNNSRSVDPRNYLTGAGGSYVGATTTQTTTSQASKLGNSISADTASYLNELEQAELDAIERSINQHNAREENKSKVQEAREARDQMVLDRLQLVAQIRENEFKIIESQIEQYDYNRDRLNTRIAQLEYKADDTARKAGKTSDSKEWRKYMSQAKASKEQQLAIQREQVAYIEQTLAADAKKSSGNRMNHVYRVQLQDRLRDAQEQVVSLRREIDDAENAILSSRVNQTFNEIDKALEKIDKQQAVIEHQRNFIDQTYADGAKKYIGSLEKELKLHNSRTTSMQKSLKTLKNLRSNLKQQPELYEQVTDKISDMEQGLRDSKLAVHELKKEIKTIEIDKLIESLNSALEKAQKESKKLGDNLHFISKEFQPDLYFNTQADILVEMQEYKTVIGDNIKRLKTMQKEVKKMPELHKRVTEELKNWEEQQISVRKEMHTLRAEFSTDFVNSIKSIYQKQQELAIEAIDKEYTEYEKMINKKLKLIDDTATEDRYQEDVTDKQEELQKLRDEIMQRSGDDSLRNQKILKDLREELADKEREYNRFIDDKERERRKEALQEELDDAKELADEKKENTNQVFEDLLNDQRKFNEIQEQIMKGQVDKYKEIYKELTGFVNNNMKDIGKSISEGLLDGITSPFDALIELTELLKKVSGSDIPVPESGLKPVAPTVGESLTGQIKGISNNLSLMNLGASASLPSLNLNKQAPNHTTTNSNTFSSLVNIENFKGTPQEKDAFVRSIESELRKLGVI